MRPVPSGEGLSLSTVSQAAGGVPHPCGAAILEPPCETSSRSPPLTETSHPEEASSRPPPIGEKFSPRSEAAGVVLLPSEAAASSPLETTSGAGLHGAAHVRGLPTFSASSAPSRESLDRLTPRPARRVPLRRKGKSMPTAGGARVCPPAFALSVCGWSAVGRWESRSQPRP